MAEFTPPPFAVKVVAAVKRVTTIRGVVQNHRGYTALVYFPGYRKPYRVGAFHQKRKAAQALGEKAARQIMRDGGPETLGERDWLTPAEKFRLYEREVAAKSREP